MSEGKKFEDYFKLVKNSFDKNKIEIPYNKIDVNVRGKNE